MKLKRMRICIRSFDHLKKEWSDAFRGELGQCHGRDVVKMDTDTFARVFSRPRMEILQLILSHAPNSILECSQRLKRDFKNVYTDIKLLESVGLVELQEHRLGNTRLRPVAKFSGIEVDWAA